MGALDIILDRLFVPQTDEDFEPVSLPDGLRMAIAEYWRVKDSNKGLFKNSQEKDEICDAISREARKIGLSTSILAGWIMLYGDDTAYTFDTKHKLGYLDKRATKIARGITP